MSYKIHNIINFCRALLVHSSVSDLRQFAHRRNVEEGDFVVASYVSSREPQNSLVMLPTHGYGSNNAECESAEHWPFF